MLLLPGPGRFHDPFVIYEALTPRSGNATANVWSRQHRAAFADWPLTELMTLTPHGPILPPALGRLI